MPDKPLVAIIILHYKVWEETVKTLQSALDSDYSNFKILIVDNDDKPQKYQILEKKYQLKNFSDLEIIQTNKNLGFAGGHNFGIRYLQKKYPKMQYFWLLNNDLEVDSKALSYLISATTKNPNIVLWGSKIFDFDNRQKLIGYGGKYKKWTGQAIAIGKNEVDTGQFDSLEVDYPQGAALFVSKECINKVGLMREDLFLFYEEISWSKEIRKNNLEVGVCPNSKVYHHESKTAGKESNLSFYYSFRNSMIVARDYWPYTLPTVFFYHSIRSIYKSKLNPSKLKAFWSGLWSFLINK